MCVSDMDLKFRYENFSSDGTARIRSIDRTEMQVIAKHLVAGFTTPSYHDSTLVAENAE